MNKKQLLELEKNAHLTIAELRAAQPTLAAPITERLEKRAHRAAIARLAGGSKKLRKIAENITVPLGDRPERTALRTSTLTALRAAITADSRLSADPEIIKELAELETAGAGPRVPGARPEVTIAETLRLDEPVAFNPEFQRDLDAARIYRLSEATGIGDDTAKVLIDNVGSVAEITGDTLTTLVKEKKLTAEQAKAAGLASSLYHLLDERPELVAAARRNVVAVDDLAKNDKETWVKIIETSKTAPPGELSVDEYAELLDQKVSRLFPTEALANRLAKIKLTDVMKHHARLAELRTLNPGAPVAAIADFSRFNTEGIGADELAKLKERHQSTVKLVNKYPGMRLADVLDDSVVSDAAKEREVRRRTTLATSFFADNAEVLSADLTPGSDDLKELKFAADASAADKSMVLGNARTYQRAMAITEDLTDAEALVGGGFPSALALATARRETIADRTGWKAELIDRYRDRARGIAAGVTAEVGSLIDIVNGGTTATGVDNVSSELLDYLKDIPGFADFFGSQDFCNCTHCQSIMSPAAYFVDLMCFVDEHITQTAFAGKPTHPLNLQTRRPDLWTLELTCENTNTPIPYLVIINEILENAVAKDAGFAGDFADRVAVGTKVYKDTLPETVDSFRQPLNLAFEELRTYLRHFERSVADLAEAANATGEPLARLRLALPPKDYELITQENAGLPFLSGVYGIPFTEAGGTIQKFDAQRLLKPMGVNREEMGELIVSPFATADGAVNIRIISEKRSAESIQNDIENIHDLTAAALDRIHRFVRLWRATGWRIGELDLVLSHLKQAGLGAGIEPATLEAVAGLHRLQSRHEVSVEDLVALWSLLPQQPILRSAPATTTTPGSPVYPQTASSLARFTTSLFDRLFNQPRFVETGGAYPQPAATFLHPALATAAPANVDPNLHRLQAGTGTDDDELYQLMIGLAKPLGIDPLSGNDNEKKFALSLRNLSLLYRHARLARLLRVSIPELFALAGLIRDLGRAHIETLSDLDALIDSHAWWKATGLTVAQLSEVVRPAFAPVATSVTAVAGTVAAETVTYQVTIEGAAQPPETITFAANADLPAVIADWNGQAQETVAFQSDSFGTETPGGDHLTIRTLAGTGPDSSLKITVDSASIFAAAPPLVVTGAKMPPLSAAEAASPADMASELVSQALESRALIFPDTAFALLPAIAPVATSIAPVAATAGNEVVTYTAVLRGGSPTSETVSIGANATIDDVVADWNANASLARAFRSDDTGAESETGTHLSVTIKGATGSTTRLSLTADSAGIFAAVVPQDVNGAEITEEQSRALIAANAASVEVADAEGRYRLVDGFDPDAALTLPAGIDPRMAKPIQEAFRSYHGRRVMLALLPGKAGVSPEILPQLIDMLGVDLDGNEYFLELRGDGPPQEIAALIARLMRLAIVFGRSPVLDSANLEFVRANGSLFGITDFDRLNTTAVRRVETFRIFVKVALTRGEEPPDLRGLLLAFDGVTRFATADQEALAALLGCDVGLVDSMQGQIALGATPLEALEELYSAVVLAQHLGVGGTTLKLVQSVNYDDLVTAGGAIQAAFRGAYEDEAEWEDKIEPFRDALLSRRRDGLVAYMVHSAAALFDEVSDLYHHYLLDVEVEGCMRTSRVAAAIDSVQLYVHRGLMNLEETPPVDPNPAHVLPENIPEEEWAWRKNYRVWEANRKIFLYPQNYLEPELRDDKTPLFETLEEELLSKEVTNEAILEAYGRYLRGFDELAHLTIAGSYHEKDEAAKRDVLHLLGVTADDPPIFYYRRVEDAHYGAVSDERATHWGAWEKLNIQVPVRKAAPLIHNGQLYVFWIRYVTKAQNRVKNGESKFTGYQHRAYVEFSRRKLDGSWTTPQKVRLDEKPFGPASFPHSYQDDGVVLDPIVPKDSDSVEILWFDFTFYSDYEPLYDSREHEVPKDDYTLAGFQWDQLYPESGEDLSIRGVNFQMWSPLDLYRLKIGPQYDYGADPEDVGVPWINPGIFILGLLFSRGKFNLGSLLPPRLVWSRKGDGASRRDIHSSASKLPCFDDYTYASLLIDEARFKRYEQPLAATNPKNSPEVWTNPQWDEVITDYLASVTKPNKIADVVGDATLEVVNGSVGDVIIQTDTDAFLLQAEVRNDGKYHLRRLNTSLSTDIADMLFNSGLEKLLATETQLGLKEHPTGVAVDAGKIHDATKTGEVDFGGAMGTYLREIFFHIPFLIANHLNSQGRHEDAQRWYHYIFDPTASETIQGLPATLTPEERRRRELDRNWRYREFRGLTLNSLRAQLSNEAAIEQYKRDPFNPHAIARLRTSAYQKAIVMKYADNLLDLGDDLFVRAFAQLNGEYLREATLKYVTAQEILGDRPARLGDCGEGKLGPKTFPNIKDTLADGSEFLMEMESIVASRFRGGSKAGLRNKLVAVNAERGAMIAGTVYSNAKKVAAAEPRGARSVRPAAVNFRTLFTSAPAAVKERAGHATRADAVVFGRKPKNPKGVSAVNIRDRVLNPKREWVAPWGWSFVREMSPIFCVPGNDRMLGYWNRVEDRLYKIRHCQDIDGVFRLLPLFAPEIDPGLLVGGKAAGLSLDDILTASAGGLPPYRFRYLVDKAKGFAAVVQGFGAALLSALEKRDSEELGKLRNVHQKNILALTTEVRKNELKIAEDSVEIVGRRQAAAEYRRGYYEALISTGLTPAETIETTARVTAIVASATRLGLATAAGFAHLLPQVGSPFAMKYGGQEVGSSLKTFATVAGIVGNVAEMVATIAGIAGGFERREQGWEHQQKLAEHDLKALQKELAVADLRKAIAARSLLLHEKATEQHDEIMEFFAEKFSNLGLYTHLSRSLQQLHREAYNNALAIARLAEQAYRFERAGDTSIFVGGEWDASRSGLLAGERLLMALHNMDKRFIETNTRQSEINQTFSVAQIDPQALIDLREIGSCEFAIPEFYFDMFYPGQYRRRVRAVRLTIPAVTGPYTNISAKLTLLRSHIRKEATLGAAQLFEVPTNGAPSVAMSTGQGDAGVFELSFRDEKYMPFEGAGAVSDWRLELPSTFRPFDYQSINDVFLNISYTSQEDGVLRQQVESQNAVVEGTLLHYLSNNTVTRVFSLRQEFSSAFNRLLESAAGTPVTIDMTDRHFPLFLQGRALTPVKATIVLSVVNRGAVGAVSMSVNGTTATAFPSPTDPPTAGDPFGGLPAKSLGSAFAGGLKRQQTITVNNAGNLAAPVSSGSLFAPDRLRDILLVIEYRV